MAATPTFSRFISLMAINVLLVTGMTWAYLAHSQPVNAASCCGISGIPTLIGHRGAFAAALFTIVSGKASFDRMFELLEAGWGVAEINELIARQVFLLNSYYTNATTPLRRVSVFASARKPHLLYLQERHRLRAALNSKGAEAHSAHDLRLLVATAGQFAGSAASITRLTGCDGA